MKYCFLLVAFLMLAACNPPAQQTEHEKVAQPEATPIVTAKQTMESFEDIDLLKRKEALKKYGTPQKHERLLLSDMMGEFWVNVYKTYSEAEQQDTTIYVDELTWEKDVEHFITVWYQADEENGVPKAHLVWHKESEF